MSANVSIDYITHRFKGQQAPTLKDVELSIHPGEQVALIGRSGCGKSTLLHMLAGLLLPSEGCVHIRGHMVTRPSAKWNMMFQKPSLYPWMSVRENAELGLLFAGKRDAQKITHLLDMVGLGDKADANVQSLSGGQQQRVALARSLAHSRTPVARRAVFGARCLYSCLAAGRGGAHRPARKADPRHRHPRHRRGRRHGRPCPDYGCQSRSHCRRTGGGSTCTPGPRQCRVQPCARAVDDQIRWLSR